MQVDLASQIQFGDASGIRDFMLVHRMAHAAISLGFEQRNVPPMSLVALESAAATEAWIATMQGNDQPEALSDWLRLHYDLHQAEFNALGFGQAPDISTVDFRSPLQFYDWMFAHATMHDQVATALGVS